MIQQARHRAERLETLYDRRGSRLEPERDAADHLAEFGCRQESVAEGLARPVRAKVEIDSRLVVRLAAEQEAIGPYDALSHVHGKRVADRRRRREELAHSSTMNIVSSRSSRAGVSSAA
jgi:hypothetical protein